MTEVASSASIGGSTSSILQGGGPRAATAVVAARTLSARVLVDPVRGGRLRDIDWPYGLRWVVAVGYLAYGLGAAVVLAASAIRRDADLAVASTLSSTIPRAWLWVPIVIVVVALTLFQTATLHASWWLRPIGAGTTLVIMGSWGLRYSRLSGGLVEAALSVLAMVALVVLVALRTRRSFVWWEFPVVLGLIGTPVVLGITVMNRTSGSLGFDFIPVYLQSTVTTLGPVAIPAAMVAGLSVAEITVSGTVWATRLTARFAARRLAYAILAALVVLRMVQAGWQLAGWDWVEQGGSVFLTWSLAAVALAGLSVLVLGLGRERERLDPASIPDAMAAMALPLALALVGLVFVSTAVVALFGVAAALAPAQVGGWSQQWLRVISSTDGANGFRLAVAVVLIGLGLVVARRGRTTTALLLIAVAVMSLVRISRWLSGGRLDSGTGPDALNLLATAAVLGLAAWWWRVGRLTPTRATTLSGALVLSTLLSYRDFVSDPLGAALGYAGAALVLFGLTWSLLTDGGVANLTSRRYPRPARVMLVLANLVFAMAVLAYTSLTRDPGATINVDDFAILGDQLLGTALVAVTYVAVLAALRASPGQTPDDPVRADSASPRPTGPDRRARRRPRTPPPAGAPAPQPVVGAPPPDEPTPADHEPDQPR